MSKAIKGSDAVDEQCIEETKQLERLFDSWMEWMGNATIKHLGAPGP